jgi:hypothetical protein
MATIVKVMMDRFTDALNRGQITGMFAMCGYGDMIDFMDDEFYQRLNNKLKEKDITDKRLVMKTAFDMLDANEMVCGGMRDIFNDEFVA